MRVDSWLKLTEKDNINFKLLKTKLTLPNPDYTKRIKMGFKTTEFNVFGKCPKCGKQIHKVCTYEKDIPKECVYCKESVKYIVEEVEMERFDKIYREVGNELWVPRGLVHSLGKGKEVENCTTLGSYKVDFKSKIQLGPSSFSEDNQTDFVETFHKHMSHDFGGIGQAPPGYGKTVCALEVIARLERPTAIITHKEFLMNQWADRITSFFDIDKNDIGFVQRDVCEFQHKKIVMIMLQSLLAREYPSELFKHFGTVCIDECHRIAAQEFRKAIVMFPARYRMGVTATPRRADGLENVFFWHIGEVSAIGEKRKLNPKIKIISTEVEPSNVELRGLYDFRGRQNFNKVVDYLITNDYRNRSIVGVLKKALKKGRKVMLLSGRLEHLERLHTMLKMEMVKDDLRFTTGYYIGGMSEEKRTISATRQAIFATYHMAEEGLDIPELDTLFLVTPRSDVEQAVGRILRTFDDKQAPTVVDFSDPIELCVSMLKKRVSFYRKMGYMD